MEERLGKLAQAVSGIGQQAMIAIAFVGNAAMLILQSFILLVRGPMIGQPASQRCQRLPALLSA